MYSHLSTNNGQPLHFSHQTSDIPQTDPQINAQMVIPISFEKTDHITHVHGNSVPSLQSCLGEGILHRCSDAPLRNRASTALCYQTCLARSNWAFFVSFWHPTVMDAFQPCRFGTEYYLASNSAAAKVALPRACTLSHLTGKRASLRPSNAMPPSSFFEQTRGTWCNRIEYA